ncbi:hypothetical protein HXA35_15630 [Bacillus sp. A301a_S52]|jgi:hypothetical protein|nr:hypothetical protein [Bacillus sp. A301a_S52]
MTVRELYNGAIQGKYESLIFVIEWFVYEKKVMTMGHDARNVSYLMTHPTKNIWPEVNRYIAMRKGHMMYGTQKTNSPPGA